MAFFDAGQHAPSAAAQPLPTAPQETEVVWVFHREAAFYTEVMLIEKHVRGKNKSNVTRVLHRSALDEKVESQVQSRGRRNFTKLPREDVRILKKETMLGFGSALRNFAGQSLRVMLVFRPYVGNVRLGIAMLLRLN